MQKKIVTQEDLDANPELKEQGVNVGDEIEIPEADDLKKEELENDDDTGGSTPPPNKDRG